MTIKKLISNTSVWGYLGLCFAFIYLPVLVLILFSFHDGNVPVPPFAGPTTKWYSAVLNDSQLMAGLRNSLLVGLGSSLVSVLLGFLAAYGLSRYSLKGAAGIRAVVVLPMMVSYLIVGMGLLIFFSEMNVAASLWGVALGHVVLNMPLCFSICMAQLGEHQRKLEMAARDLGASTFQVLTRITAPLIMPALIAAFALSLTLSWDEFLVAYLLTRFDVTLPISIWSMLRTGLNPQTNAIGSLVFGCSILLIVCLEFFVLRKKKS